MRANTVHLFGELPASCFLNHVRKQFRYFDCALNSRKFNLFIFDSLLGHSD